MSRSGTAGPKIGPGSRLWAKRNRPTPPFVWFTMEMMVSPAWRAMSLTARRVLDRLCVEHMAHAGTENGNLVVTYSDFRKAGIGGKNIGNAIDELVALGFIAVDRGRGGNAEFRRPNRYTLTWLTTERELPTNRWRSVTLERAEATQEALKATRRRKTRVAPPAWSEAAPPRWGGKAMPT